MVKMSTETKTDTFPLEIMGNTTVVDHKEFHDIESDTVTPVVKIVTVRPGSH